MKSTCIKNCGDGLKLASEDCDDFNTISGDGCSDQCQVENGYVCIPSGNGWDICLFAPTVAIEYISEKNEIFLKFSEVMQIVDLQVSWIEV